MDEFAAAFPFRVRQLEDDVKGLRNWRGVVDIERTKQEEQLKTQEAKLDSLIEQVASLRRVLLGFALSVAGSAIVFALTTLIAVGKI